LSTPNINDSNGLLLYRVGPVLVCSSTMPVEAVIMPPKITVPPGASIAEPGVFKSIHGMVRLVDLRVRFGVEKEDYTQPGKIIIVEVEGGYAGFWVDEIEDVTGFPNTGWAQVPAYIPQDIFSRTWVKDKTIRLYADFDKLDKFKTSGYLRKHIEMIKAVDVDDASSATSEKNNQVKKIVSNKKNENKLIQTHQLDGNDFDGKKNNETGLAEDSLKLENINNKNTASASAEKKGEIESDYPTGFSQNNNLDYKQASVATEVKAESKKLHKATNIASHRVKSESNKSAGPIEVKATRPLESENNLTSEHRKHVSLNTPGQINKPSDLLKNNEVVNKSRFTGSKTHNSKSLSSGAGNDGQQKVDDISGTDNNGKMIWGVLVVVLGIAMIYFLFLLPSEESQKSGLTRKYVEPVKKIKVAAIENIKVEEDVLYKHKVIESIPDAEEEIEVEKSIDVEAAVKISKVDDGMLIVINNYKDDSAEYVEDATDKRIKPDIVSGQKVNAEENKKLEDEFESVETLSEKNSTDTDLQKTVIEDAHLKAEGVDATEVEKEVVISDPQDISKESVDDETNSLKNNGSLKLSIKSKEDGSAGSLTASEVVENKNSEVVRKVDRVSADKIVKDDIKKIKSKKYVHVVIKGDTLWHIAKRYVNNPWRYPELARLSRIKNPDLIYPGDRVTIIINYNKSQLSR